MTADTVMLRTLDQLLPGQTAVIKQIGGRGSFRRRVMDLGLTVLRFRYNDKDNWERICADHAYVFGKVRA